MKQGNINEILFQFIDTDVNKYGIFSLKNKQWIINAIIFVFINTDVDKYGKIR